MTVVLSMVMIPVFAAALFVFEKTQLAAVFPAAASLNLDVAHDDSNRHDEHDKKEGQ